MAVLTMASVTTRIRAATLADVPALVDLGRRFIRETGYRHLIRLNPPALERLAVQLIMCAKAPSIVLVAERQGTLIGMFGLMAYPHPMSDDLTVAELMWWINPEARGAGLRLYRAGERWAKDQGPDVVLQMIAPTDDVETLYTRLGFVPVERTFQKRLA